MIFDDQAERLEIKLMKWGLVFLRDLSSLDSHVIDFFGALGSTVDEKFG